LLSTVISKGKYTMDKLAITAVVLLAEAVSVILFTMLMVWIAIGAGA
jgi:hypothetical protein